jgi:hypothetical protein
MRLKWCFELYEIQRAANRYFLHEQPWGAWSWWFDFVQEMMEKRGVLFVKGAQCPFEHWSVDVEGVGLVLKLTGWLTNSEEIAARVGVECANKLPGAVPHRHVQLIGGRASATEVYPLMLVLAILEGLVAQLTKDGVMQDGGIGMICEMNVEQEADVDWTLEEGWDHIDDVSGKPLDSAKVNRHGKMKLDTSTSSRCTRRCL